MCVTVLYFSFLCMTHRFPSSSLPLSSPHPPTRLENVRETAPKAGSDVGKDPHFIETACLYVMSQSMATSSSFSLPSPCTVCTVCVRACVCVCVRARVCVCACVYVCVAAEHVENVINESIHIVKEHEDLCVTYDLVSLYTTQYI